MGEKENIEKINSIFPDLESLANQWLTKENVPVSKQILRRFIDMRYQRQNYEYQIELREHRLTGENFDQILNAFHEEHKKNHGYAIHDSPIEFVNYRVTAYGIVPKADVVSYEEAGQSPEKALKGYRKVCFDLETGFLDCPIYEMGDLFPQNQITGPAVIEQTGSTIIIPPSETATVDIYKNIHIQIHT